MAGRGYSRPGQTARSTGRSERRHTAMRWIKHPSACSRSAAVADIRDALALPDMAHCGCCLSAWPKVGTAKANRNCACRSMSGLKPKSLDLLLAILEEHAVLFCEIEERKMRVRAPTLLQMQDDWTSRTRRNSGVTPEPHRSGFGTETDREPDKEKDNNTRLTGKHLFSVKTVLHRHGIDPDSRRGEALIRYVERMSNPRTITKEEPCGFKKCTSLLAISFNSTLNDCYFICK